MIVKSLFAAALIVGSASMAVAQTATYDGYGDKTLSYGPRSAPAISSSPSSYAADTVNPYDGMGDKTNSYGARTAR